MDGGMCARKRLWRWRSNPLRRCDDIVEAWIVLAVWAVIAVGGTLVGLLTAHAAEDTFAAQRAERHSTRAVLLTDIPATSARFGGTERVAAKVRWSTPDGSAHTGKTLVDAGRGAGAKIVVWLDGRGELTTEPPSPADGDLEAGLLSTGAAFGLAGAVFGAGAVARWRLSRRRIDRWGREWDLVGPRWGHKTG
jgi:hypothetical protein